MTKGQLMAIKDSNTRITFVIEKTQKEALKLAADQRHQTVSALAGEIISDWLDSQEGQKDMSLYVRSSDIKRTVGTSGQRYVVARSDRGYFMDHDGERVNLVNAIHKTNEIRWTVIYHPTMKKVLNPVDSEAVELAGLTPWVADQGVES